MNSNINIMDDDTKLKMFLQSYISRLEDNTLSCLEKSNLVHFYVKSKNKECSCVDDESRIDQLVALTLLAYHASNNI
jgi:hypothetical protein